MFTPATEAGVLEERLRRTARLVATAGVIVLLAQAASIVVDAFSRWLFNTPIPGLEDINIVMIAVTVASFMPALFMERANITVNLVGRAAGRRVSDWLDAFGHLLAFIFIVLLTWQYLLYAIELGPTYTVILELPKRPGALVVSALLGVSAVFQGVVLAVVFSRIAGVRQAGVRQHSGVR